MFLGGALGKKCSEKLLKNYRKTQEAVIIRCSVKKKMFLQIFVKFTKSIFAGVSFLIKLQAGNSQNFTSSHWRYSVKEGALKNFANLTGNNLCWSLFLIKLQFWGRATLLKKTLHAGSSLWNLKLFSRTSVNVYF